MIGSNLLATIQMIVVVALVKVPVDFVENRSVRDILLNRHHLATPARLVHLNVKNWGTHGMNNMGLETEK